MRETCLICGAPATIIEGDGFSPDQLVCDTHSRFQNTALPLPVGYHARALGAAGSWPSTSGGPDAAPPPSADSATHTKPT